MSIRRAAACGALFAVATMTATLPASAQAVLSLDAGNSFTRGERSSLAVNLTVKAKPVSFHKLYVRVRCKEMVDLTQTVTEESKDAKDDKIKKVSSKSINVKKEEVLFEKEIPFPTGKEFAPGSTQMLKAEFEIPGHLPPTFRGKFTRVKWEAEIVGDVVGKFWDANSGTQEINVK
jgi:hypothetical protein